jgi:hypothetical protein
MERPESTEEGQMEIDDRARSAGPGARPPRETLRRRLARLRLTLQDRLWSDHEKWAADRGYESWRSPYGWTVYGRDPRFDRRHACVDCDATGRHRITGDECPECRGNGVVTRDVPEDGELR